MLRRVLVANRGEIAVRVIRTCGEMGIESVAVYSDADAWALHVRSADHAVRLPGTAAARTYLDAALLVDTARASGADAVHPGYGFLSESADFAARVERAGLVFVGPPSSAIAALGDKVSARALARAAGVPVVPGVENPDADGLAAFGDANGWPVVVKAVHGGGGRGMRVVHDAHDAKEALRSARTEARAAFGSGDVYVEQYLHRPRHVEVQVFADTHGAVVALGDRDCSVQRRHQKLVEESPAPGLVAALRNAMAQAAVALVASVPYTGAATVEFLVQDGAFYFLECNTRIQVEHPVTEAVFGVDLVREQLRVAAGEHLDVSDTGSRGHAVEVRLNAEDPATDFLPSSGTIHSLRVPMRPGVRVDTGYEPGDELPPYYDGLIAKLVVWGPTRAVALHRLQATLRETRVDGVHTTAPALLAATTHPGFGSGGVSTHWFEDEIGPTLTTQRAASREPDEPTDLPGDGVVIAGRRHRIPAAASGSGSARPTVRRPRTATAPAGKASVTRTAAAARDLVSPMNGTVTSVDVVRGSAVDPGTVVATVEAMKMEHRIVATADGTIEAVCVQPGDPVAAGAAVVRLAPLDVTGQPDAREPHDAAH